MTEEETKSLIKILSISQLQLMLLISTNEHLSNLYKQELEERKLSHAKAN